MPFRDKIKQILHELKAHSPFTLFGAATGIVFMLIGERWFKSQAHALFSVFHPLHVVLSAMVTAALFELHRNGQIGTLTNRLSKQLHALIQPCWANAWTLIT